MEASKVGGFVLLIATVAVLCALPFLPLIRDLSAGVVAYIATLIPSMADTPITPIVGLIPILAIGVIMIAVAISVIRS